jgi:hypothetical protein
MQPIVESPQTPVSSQPAPDEVDVAVVAVAEVAVVAEAVVPVDASEDDAVVVAPLPPEPPEPPSPPPLLLLVVQAARAATETITAANVQDFMLIPPKSTGKDCVVSTTDRGHPAPSMPSGRGALRPFDCVCRLRIQNSHALAATANALRELLHGRFSQRKRRARSREPCGERPRERSGGGPSERDIAVFSRQISIFFVLQQIERAG